MILIVYDQDISTRINATWDRDISHPVLLVMPEAKSIAIADRLLVSVS